MPSFSDRSETQLATCHADLRRVLNEAIRLIDFAVLEGHRSPGRQEYLYEIGASKVLKGKHNELPSLAVDIAPWPVNWADRERFVYFAGVVMGIAGTLGVALRWGGDWDRDTELADETFRDLGHFELVTP